MKTDELLLIAAAGAVLFLVLRSKNSAPDLATRTLKTNADLQTIAEWDYGAAPFGPVGLLT